MRQLPTEARRFQSVDQLWRKTLGDTANDPNFMVQADPEKQLEGKFIKANENTFEDIASFVSRENLEVGCDRIKSEVIHRALDEVRKDKSISE